MLRAAAARALYWFNTLGACFRNVLMAVFLRTSPSSARPILPSIFTQRPVEGFTICKLEHGFFRLGGIFYISKGGADLEFG